MNDIINLNKTLQMEFYKTKAHDIFEQYVMSELLSPIEDYINAMDLVEKYDDLCKGLNLHYIACYLSSTWVGEKNVFLDRLNEVVDMANNEDKAIIYYLNAYHIFNLNDYSNLRSKYMENILRSIEYSKDICFVNNRLDYANICPREEAHIFLREAKNNVQQIETKETLETKGIEYWLSSRRYVNEFILGTHLSLESYLYKFRGIE